MKNNGFAEESPGTKLKNVIVSESYEVSHSIFSCSNKQIILPLKETDMAYIIMNLPMICFFVHSFQKEEFKKRKFFNQ